MDTITRLSDLSAIGSHVNTLQHILNWYSETAAEPEEIAALEAGIAALKREARALLTMKPDLF